MTWARTWLVAVRAVAPRPDLWVTAVRSLVALAPNRWWRHPPFLPLPPGEYVRFRAVTQYGDPGAIPSRDDVIHFLSWCRDVR